MELTTICTRHKLPYHIVTVDLPDRDAAKDWIDRNQIGRRNLTPDQLFVIQGRRYLRVKKAIGGRADRNFSGGKNCHPKTDEQLAEEHGVSPRTIRNAAAFVRSLDDQPNLIIAILRRETTVATQAKAAAVAGVPQNTLSRWESERNIQMDNMFTPDVRVKVSLFGAGGRPGACCARPVCQTKHPKNTAQRQAAGPGSEE